LHRLLDEMLNQLPSKLESLTEAEERLQPGLRRLGAASLQGWAESASRTPPACPQFGVSMRHRGLARRTLVTVLGTIRAARPRRRCDCCGKESDLHDALLCLESRGAAYGRNQKFATKTSFYKFVIWKAAAAVSRLG